MHQVALIGEGGLARYCIERLASSGLPVSMCASFDGSLRAHAPQGHLDTREAVTRYLREHGCDYLFSVGNPWIVPDDLLRGVRKLAVNFHDAPLPRYAGLYATSWALLHGEREHGVSWHLMSAEIDAGDIVSSWPVTIDLLDTARTLNTKCFEAGARSFDRLLEGLLGDTLQRRPQRGARSYFGASMRPPAAALLDWRTSARQIVDLVRALDFGAAWAPLGCAKLWLGSDALVVRAAAPLEAPGGAPVGSLLASRPGSLCVATSDGAVRLSGLTTLEGEPLSDQALARRVGAALVGGLLPTLASAQVARLDAYNQGVCRHEARWAARLQLGVLPVRLAWAAGEPTSPSHTHALPAFTRALAELRHANPPGCAPGELGQAVLASYLMRHADEGPFDLGLVQPRARADGLGLFVDVVPQRIEPRSTGTFSSLAERLARELRATSALGSYARDLPLRHPTLRGRATAPSRWPVALATEPLDLQDGLPADLVFVLPAGDGAPQLLAARALSAQAVDACDRQLATLARSAASAPETAVGSLCMSDATERARLLVDWNQTRAPLPQETVCSLIHQQALREPLAVAVRFESHVIRYGELDVLASRLCAALQARGVHSGDRVALLVHRSAEMIAALLGILRAGGVYVPIDPSLPAARVHALLTQCQPRLAISDDAALLGFADCPTILLADALSKSAVADAPMALAHDDVAYVIFTSGSTGTPKGVEVSHGGLLNHALAAGTLYELGNADRVLCTTSLGFDLAAEQIYPALVCGAEVVVRPEGLFDALADFDAFVRAHEISVLMLPTGLWHAWVHSLRARRADAPATLRAVGVGTERVLGETLRVFDDLTLGRVRFLQGYGPTEATITCTMYVHDGRARSGSEPVPIGRPIPNMEAYVLDASLQPVAVGLEGDLYVGGVGLARGYLSSPDLTAAHFIAHPFSEESGARLYRTGDRARFQADGQLVYVGRSDGQLKLRGFRVEPGEIETLLGAQPDVAECAVVAWRDADAAATLVAYVVGRGSAPSTSRLIDACRAQLPEYMVPSVFMVLDALPRLPSGKLARAALPRPQPLPATTDTDDERAHGRPRDDLELIVADAMAAALGVGSISREADFFALGGDSLSALRMLDQVRLACGVRLPLTATFSAPSPVALAARLRAGGGVAQPTLICLRRGTGVPLVLVCGIHVYQPLARALEGDHAVYALTLPAEAGLLTDGNELPSVDALADAYLALLRSHVPHGPYALGGLSFGGAVAFALAQVLVAAGEQVALLALFDTVLPRARRWGVRGRVRRLVLALRSMPGGALVSRLRQRLAAAALARAPRAPGHAHDLKRARLRERAYERQLVAWDVCARPYTGATVLYRAASSASMARCEDHGFRDLTARDFEICDVGGDHMSMLDMPHVARLARALSARLASCTQAASLRAHAADAHGLASDAGSLGKRARVG